MGGLSGRGLWEVALREGPLQEGALREGALGGSGQCAVQAATQRGGACT